MTSLENKRLTPHITVRTSSIDSIDPSTAAPRAPRFAEATSVVSPLDLCPADKPAFSNHYFPQPQPADVGFGYLASHEPKHLSATYGPDVEMPATPRSPLRSTLKTPGAAARTFDGPLSPTFVEEQVLEKRETETEKEQVKDLVRPPPPLTSSRSTDQSPTRK